MNIWNWNSRSCIDIFCKDTYNSQVFEWIQHDDVSEKSLRHDKTRSVKNVTIRSDPKSTNQRDEKILFKKIPGLKIDWIDNAKIESLVDQWVGE